MNEQEMNEMLDAAFGNGYNEGWNEGHAHAKRQFIELLKKMLEKAEDIDAGSV